MKTIEVKNLNKSFAIREGWGKTRDLRVLKGLDFDIEQGQILGLVGESGCGKSTLAKVLTRLEGITAGEISINGQAIEQVKRQDFTANVQMVFQDPYQSLNPRKKIWELISLPLKIHHKVSDQEARLEAEKWIARVGLRPELADRYPHELSGGQRQRVGIARALILKPKFLILDEPVSALDVSIQAQVLNLLVDLHKEFKFTALLISHDLEVICHVCDQVMVMYLGEIVENGTREQIFKNPQHPYTKMLMASAPEFANENKKATIAVKGELPSAFNPPSGCTFHPRCSFATEQCKIESPRAENKIGRVVRCWQVK